MTVTTLWAIYEDGRKRGHRRGQSEVIGTVLMVSIVVLIAAAAGSFIFGLDIVQDGERTVAPHASFDATSDGDDVTIEHVGGESLDMDEIEVMGGDGQHLPDDEWTAGMEATVTDVDEGESVKVVWNSAEGDESDTLYTYTHE